MSPEAGRARAILLRLLLPALWLLPAGAAFAAAPKAGEKRICVPSADGKAWECGTPDNPPPERGLPAPVDSGSSAAPPAFLAAPPSDPTHVYAAPAPAPARPLPDQFPSVERADAALPAPEPATAAAADVGNAEAAPAAGLAPPAPATAEAPVPPAPATVDSSAEAVAPPPFLAAPPVRRPVPLAPAEAAREEALAEVPAVSEPMPPPAAAVASSTTIEPIAGTATATSPPPASPALEAPSTDAPATGDSAAASTAGVAPAPVVAPLPSEPPSSPPAFAPTLRTPAEFLRLPAGAWTAQLGRSAGRVDGALAAIGNMARTSADPFYLVAVGAPDSRQWLLLWSRFDDADAARRALRAAGMGGIPRRVGPLQSEVRAAGTLAPPAHTGVDAAASEPTDGGASRWQPAPDARADSAALALPAAANFDALPAHAWTVQLARAGSSAGFGALMARNGLSSADCHVVALDAGGVRAYLLLWSQFPDADAARAAARSLRGAPGAFVRRIGPLQAEARRAR